MGIIRLTHAYYYKSSRYLLLSYWLFMLIIVSVGSIDGQIIDLDSLKNTKTNDDSIHIVTTDSISFDSLIFKNSETNQDSSKETTAYSISNDAISSEVIYGSKDSMIFDNTGRFIYLYGEAFVKYTSIELKAGFITIDIRNNIATAEGIPDSAGRMSEPPEFKDGDQQFTARKMRYNFNTKTGMVYQAVSKEKDVYIRGDKTKFISGSGDSLKTDDIIYNQNAIFTTCDNPTPHFGIRSTKQKIIPNKMMIIGPSLLEIGGIPTPLFLPFGFFPISNHAHSGLILPRSYDYSDRYGFGLKDIGYYIPINDYMDIKLLGEIYLNGSFSVGTDFRYSKKYNYSGNLILSFSNRTEELPNDYNTKTDRSFKIRWNHRQDPKANPFHNLGGSINISTNQYDRLNTYRATDRLNNSLNSNVTYRRTFPGKPFSLTSSFYHSQNIEQKDITFRFPNLQFNVRTIYPFKMMRSDKTVSKWYDEISFRYDFEVANELTTKDTAIFTQQSLDLLKYDAKHTVSSDINFKILKYFNFSPRVSFKEFWHFKRLDKSFDSNPLIMIRDTVVNPITGDSTINRDTTFGQILIDTINQFHPFHQFDASATLNTKIFGTILFKKGKLRGLRHVITPSVSINYRPNYRQESAGYYKHVDTDSRDNFNNPQGYSTFLYGVTGTPSISNETYSMSYSIGNNFEGKYFSRKDSTRKKFKFFESLNLNGNYNFAADSFKFSPVSINGSTRLIKGVSDLRFNASFDPYAEGLNGAGRRNLLEKDHSGKYIRFDFFSARIGTGLTIGKLREMITNLYTKKESSRTDSRKNNNNDLKEEDFISLFENFSIRHDYNFTIERSFGRDSFIVTNNSLTFRGNIPLTKNWKIEILRVGYNFLTNKLTYPDINLVRDLHCWEMRFGWQPQYNSFQFFLGVRPGTLDFVKVPYNRINTSF